MTIQFRTPARADSLVVPAPTGLTDGDMMVATITADGSGSAATGPAGWTKREEHIQSGGQSYQCAQFTKIASGESGDYTFVMAGASGIRSVIIAYYDDVGGGTFSFVESSQRNDIGVLSTTTDAVAALTDDRLLAIYFSDGTRVVDTAPAGMTQEQLDTGGAGASTVIAWYGENLSGDEPTAQRTLSWTVSEDIVSTAVVLRYATASTPTVVSVDGDDIVIDGQQDVAVVVSDFTSDITTISLRGVGGLPTVALTDLQGTGDNYTVDMMDVTAIVLDTQGVPFTLLPKYLNEIVADDGTDTASIEIDWNPKAGYQILLTASAVTTKGSIFEGRAGGSPADDSMIYYPTADNTSITATGVITSDADTVIGHLWDITSENWERWEINWINSTPDQFTFVDVTNAELSTPYENIQFLTGADAGETLTEASALLALSNDGISWFDSILMVVGQSRVRAQVTSSASGSTQVDQTVSVNGVSDTFSVTTKVISTTPDQFTFTDVVDADLSAPYEDIQFLTGVTDGQTLTEAAALLALSNDGISWFSSISMLAGSSRVRAQVTSSANFLTAVTQTPSVNTVSDTFSVTTRAAEVISFSGTVGDRSATIDVPFSLSVAGNFSTELTPITYSLQAGTLPVGLSLNASTGEISGTPTVLQNQTGIVIRGTDTGLNTADTNAFAINVVAASTSSGSNTIRIRIGIGI